MKSANLFATLFLGASVWATSLALAQQQDSRDVSLVRQDFSDCSNADVSDRDPSLVGGTALVARASDATTQVLVNLASRPDTSYHFFLKCVRLLGDLTTDGEGFGTAIFQFRTESAGDVFAFDMYPEGAPLGDKFQSVQVNFRDPGPVVEPSPRIEYVSQTAGGVSVFYADMPPRTEIVLVNAMTDSDTQSSSITLDQGGAGSADIAIPISSQGAYYVLARGLADGHYIAETVTFYPN